MIFFSILILITAIAIPSINNNISSNNYIRISSIILLYSGLLALNAINIPALGSGFGLFNGLFHVTLMSQLMDCFIFLIGSLILVAWPLINNKKYNHKISLNNLNIQINKINTYAIEYSLIILFSTLGASFLVSSADIISMYLSLELQSFGIYILTTIFRDSDSATSAGLKYFLLGGLSSCLILLGGGLIYSFTGLTNFESIYSLIAVSDNNKIILGFNLGFIFIIVGLLFKIAAAPLHNWAPAKRNGNTLWWVKLSNSGDTLKLLVPNYSRKVISGWTNYSCTEIIQKISEKIMGYRGSKSDFNMKSVKEQRVDGSLWIKQIHVRCTLMGFERNYQIKIPSKQLNKNIKNFSTLQPQPKITPWFVTGLIDAEGSFIISINRKKELKLGWFVRSIFSIGFHKRDLSLLLQLQQFFGGIGSITLTQNMVLYSVAGIKDLTTIIIPHFKNFPLLTQKAADFILFQRVVILMSNKVHLTIEGLHQIINIKASINLGLSDNLKSEFREVSSVERILIITNKIPNPNWVSGFVTGEGNFDVRFSKSKNRLGLQTRLRFRITQHERDLKLMELLIKYLGTGKIEKDPRFPAVSLKIEKFSDITKIIIPFFDKYPLLGIKLFDYLDWCKIAKLMNEKSHLTIAGLNFIIKIKAGMNKGRKIT